MERQNSGRDVCCLSTQGEQNVSFVMHQWVMAAIILPSGYKQAVLEHTVSTPKQNRQSSPQWGCPGPAGKMECESMWGIKIGGERFRNRENKNQEIKQEGKEQVPLHTKDKNASVKIRGKEENRTKEVSVPDVWIVPVFKYNGLSQPRPQSEIWHPLNKVAAADLAVLGIAVGRAQWEL